MSAMIRHHILQNELLELETMRKQLRGHDRDGRSQSSSCATTATATDNQNAGSYHTPRPHRTVDATTLQLLKSSNYPFSLCEEAPFSYSPPSVPYDVEGEVCWLKSAVMHVQERIARHVLRTQKGNSSGGNGCASDTNTNKDNSSTITHGGEGMHTLPQGHARSRRANENDESCTQSRTQGGRSGSSDGRVHDDGDDDTEYTFVQETRNVRSYRADIIPLLARSNTFAQLAWRMSKLQCFLVWVLSHSMSHLANAREQLEYVLSEPHCSSLAAAPLPASSEMDLCLRLCPFPTAVTILETDRQHVITEERVRLHSDSASYRARLPYLAVTAAQSDYLSCEEKYMYQELYNRSVHALRMYLHAQAKQAHDEEEGDDAHKTRHVSQQHSNDSDDQSRTGSSQASLSECNASADPGAALRHVNRSRTIRANSAAADEQTRVDRLGDELSDAIAAEREMASMLIDSIAHRRATGVRHGTADSARERSRVAQTAVYGCIVSDMSLMGYQIRVAQTVLRKYGEWLRYHDLGSHDTLMTELTKRRAGVSCSALPEYTLVDASATCNKDHNSIAEGSHRCTCSSHSNSHVIAHSCHRRSSDSAAESGCRTSARHTEVAKERHHSQSEVPLLREDANLVNDAAQQSSSSRQRLRTKQKQQQQARKDELQVAQPILTASSAASAHSFARDAALDTHLAKDEAASPSDAHAAQATVSVRSMSESHPVGGSSDLSRWSSASAMRTYLCHVYVNKLRSVLLQLHSTEGHTSSKHIPETGASLRVSREWLLRCVHCTVTLLAFPCAVATTQPTQPLNMTCDARLAILSAAVRTSLEKALLAQLNAESKLSEMAPTACALVRILNLLVSLLTQSTHQSQSHAESMQSNNICNSMVSQSGCGWSAMIEVHSPWRRSPASAEANRISTTRTGSQASHAKMMTVAGDEEHTMSTEELVQWGWLVDALWFEADPSQQFSGGMLPRKQADLTLNEEKSATTRRSCANPAAAGGGEQAMEVAFARLERATLAPAALRRRQGQTSTAATVLSLVPSLSSLCSSTVLLTLYYSCSTGATAVEQSNVQTERMSCWLHRTVRHAPTEDTVMAGLVYGTRCVLRALAECEDRQILMRYACGRDVVDLVCLADYIYLTSHTSARTKISEQTAGHVISDEVVVTAVHLPPPPALQLLRLQALNSSAPAAVIQQQHARHAAVVALQHWSEGSVGMLIAAMLRVLCASLPASVPFSELYMMAEHLHERSVRRSHVGGASAAQQDDKVVHPLLKRLDDYSTRCAVVEQ